MSANPPQAFCREKITKCLSQYLPSFSRFCPHTLREVIPYSSETQGIYMIICLSLRSNRQSLSRQQGIILKTTANAVAMTFSDMRTMDIRWDFFGKSRILGSKTRIGKRTEWHATIYNEHIGSMAALPPLEKKCEIESLPPAGKCLEAATAPICQT
jgi:hypothetical protein